MPSGLMTKSQFQTLIDQAAVRSPFKHTNNRLITPTITKEYHEYLSKRLVKKVALFSGINSKSKKVIPFYSAGVFHEKKPLVVLVKTPTKVQEKPAPIKTTKPAPVIDFTNVEPHKASLMKAMAVNGWNPECPLPMKKNWYMDPRELFYRVARVQMCGGLNSAGRDGERAIELFGLLASNFIGRICFKDQGHMANMADDLIQEATTKCAMVVDRFSVWDLKEPGKINNAFAYFTTVARNKMFETLTSNLAVSDVHIEDLKTDSQSVGDLI